MPLSKLICSLATTLATLLFFIATAEAATPDPENALIYKLDVWVRTCDKDNAGTDSTVSVMFRNDGDRFYLDQPGDDRERGDWSYYQVLPDDVTRIKDITRLELKVHGNDAWCFDYIWLWINGEPVYLEASETHWIDGDSDTNSAYYKVTSSMLRDDYYWPEKGESLPDVCEVPKTLPKYDMEDLMIDIVGDYITEGDDFPDRVQKVKWRGSGAKLSRRDSNSWRFDVDLRVEVKDYWDADADATYDIDVSCGDGQLTMRPRLRSSSIKFDIPWYVSVLTGGIVNIVNAFVDANVEKRLERALKKFDKSFEVPTEAEVYGRTIDVCPSIDIDSDAHLNLGWNSLVTKQPALCL